MSREETPGCHLQRGKRENESTHLGLNSESDVVSLSGKKKKNSSMIDRRGLKLTWLPPTNQDAQDARCEGR